MFPRILLLTVLVLTFSSATFGLYFVVDYFMDHGFPKMFGQACDDYVQDNCVYVNSHLNTFGHWDYRGHIRCKMTLDAGKQRNATYKVKWHRFKLEATDCSDDKDYLEFHDASLDHYTNDTRIGRYCGWTYPHPNLTSNLTQQYFTMVWRTDGSREDKGFRFMATRILPYPCPDGDYYHCKAENVCMDSRLKCDGIEQCDDGEDESECSTWEKIIGGFLALGTAGVTGVSCACLFACIVAWVIVGCIYRRLRKKPDDTVVKIEISGGEGSGGQNNKSGGGNNKVAPDNDADPPGKSAGSRWGALQNFFGKAETAKIENDAKPTGESRGGLKNMMRTFGARGAGAGLQRTPKLGTDAVNTDKKEAPKLTAAGSKKGAERPASATSWSSKDAW